MAVLQSFCLVTLELIMLDVDEENISQNDSLCLWLHCNIFLPSYTPSSFFLALTGSCSPLIIFRKECCSKVSFFSCEQRAALLDFISSEFRTRRRVTSYCSVVIEGTVAVEGVAQGKGIVMGRLNAEQN